MKRIKTILCILIIFLIIGSIYYHIPKKIDKEYEGIKYQLGNIDYTEKIKIHIKGLIYNRFFKEDKFEGTIKIGNKEMVLLVPEFSYNSAQLYYKDPNYKPRYYNSMPFEYDHYGSIYTKNLREKFTITIPTLDEQRVKSTSKSWSSEDGLMISAPATNREEALAVSNELLKNTLGDYILK